jgi:hypothetical protein
MEFVMHRHQVKCEPVTELGSGHQPILLRGDHIPMKRTKGADLVFCRSEEEARRLDGRQ